MKLRIPEGLKLKKFQRRLLKEQLANPSPYIYDASDPGLGKTIMTAVYANSLGVKKLLTVCPANLCLNTIKEYDKWLMPNIEYVVVSYSLLVSRPKLLRELREYDWDLITFDEAQYLKNPSKRQKKSISLFDCSKYGVRWSSGSPITRCATDIYAILSFVAARTEGLKKSTREHLKDMETFGKRYAYKGYATRSRKTSQRFSGIKSARAPELERILYKEMEFFYRTTQEEALPELPELTMKTVPLRMTVDMTMYPEIVKEFKKYFQSYEAYDPSSKRRPPSYTKLRRLLGQAKASCRDIYEYIETFLDAGSPVVIMCSHKNVVAQVQDMMRKHKTVIYTGDISAKEKDRAVNKFQDGKADVFIGNVLAAGLGITLVRSHDMFFMEPPWLWDDVKQAIRRIQRIGQKNACTGHFFVSKNKIDQLLHQRLEVQKKQIEMVI